jgi:hypothetical protein
VEGVIKEMDNLINMLVGDLTLTAEYVFTARVIVLVLCVEVLSSLLSAIVPLVRSVR